MQPGSRGQRPKVLRRRRIPGTRAHQACLYCKDKKLKCDDQVPACSPCKKLGIECLVQDPLTKRPRARNYLAQLEGRVANLESGGQSSRSPPSPLLTAESHVEESTPSYSRTPDQGQKASDLSSSIGALECRTTHVEPQYLGSSSAFAFSRLINLSLTRDLPITPTFINVADGSTSPPSPGLLPEYDTAVKLSDAYFKHMHPQYPFLHEPTFRRWENELYTSSRSSTEIGYYTTSLFFLNMVYAIAALLTPSTQALAEQLYMSAQLYTDVLSNNNVESIQALLCYAMYSMRSPTGPSLWKLTGLAIRQCIELGYHRSTKRYFFKSASPLQNEMRRRVFWVAHGMDCMIAMRLGRPLGIPLQEIDAEFPMNVDDASVTESGIFDSTTSDDNASEQRMTTTSTAIHVFKLRCIWARIHTSFFSDTARLSVDDMTYTSRIQQLRADLDEWLATTPPSREFSSSDLTMFLKQDWYELNYSYTLILLYRNQLAEFKDSSSQIFQDCLQAARTICQGYRRLYIGTSIRYTWSTLHVIFLAGLVYLHCLWTSPTARTAIRPEEITKTCTDCTMVLVAIAEGWQGASPYRDAFEALASRTIGMIMNSNFPAASPTQWQVPPDFGGHDNWAFNLNDLIETGGLDGLDGLLEGFIVDFTQPDVY